MATTARTPEEDLYPRDRPRRPHRRGVIDDTLDAQPPYHLFEGTPTAAEIAAAQQLAAERGYPLPASPSSRAQGRNGAQVPHPIPGGRRPKRAAESRGLAKE